MEDQNSKDDKSEKNCSKNSSYKYLLMGIGLILVIAASIIGIRLTYDNFINNINFFNIGYNTLKHKNIEENKSFFQKLKAHNSLKTKIIDITNDKNYISANSLNDHNNIEISKEFICPITQKIMEEPVITPYGTNYEKSAIIDWIKRYNIDFKTENFLSEDMLVSNHILKIAIKEYKESINLK